MATLRRVVLAVVALCLPGLMMCQMGMPGMGRKKEEKAPAVKSDIQYIRCQVCQHLVKQAQRMVKQMRADLKPGKKLEEGNIIDKLENLSNPDKDEGEWITMIDLQEEGDELKVVDVGQVSKCNTECRTVARASEQIQEELDLSDLSELLFLAKKKRKELTQWACYESTNACGTPAPRLPKDRVAGPKHVPMTAAAAENAKLMRSLEAKGMKGQLYDSESAMDEVNRLQEMSGNHDGPMFEGEEEMFKGLDLGAGGGDTKGGSSADGSGLVDSLQSGAEKALGTAKEAAQKAGTFLKSSFDKLTGKAGEGDRDSSSSEL